MKNCVPAFVTFCLAALLAGCDRKEPPPEPAPEAENPIFIAYHGGFFDAQGRELHDLPKATTDAFLEKRNAELAAMMRSPPGPGGGTPPVPAATYVDGCVQAGVPIPPPWGDPAWSNLGVLPPDRTFVASAGNTTQVWAYNDPNGKGMCFALPRIETASGDIKLLGIICQSKQTGKACFWDNVDKNTGNRIEGAATAGMKVQDLQDATSLKENCTGCHRGDNAFIVHVGTVLEVAPPFNSDPDTRYDPFTGTSARAGWGNPPSGLPLRNTQCVQCHEMPEVTIEYCETVLKKSIGTTMPPAPPPPAGQWDPDYRDDATDLSRACKALGVDLGLGL